MNRAPTDNMATIKIIAAPKESSRTPSQCYRKQVQQFHKLSLIWETGRYLIANCHPVSSVLDVNSLLIVELEARHLPVCTDC